MKTLIKKHHPKRNAEYFKRVKICGITFGVF